MKGIIGRKLGMSQIFDEMGAVIPVTVIEAGPCVVLQKKTKETDGYEAIKIAFGDIRAKLVNKPKKGVFDKAGLPYKRHIKEFPLSEAESINVGDIIKADTFAEGERVDISGTSKGKGFAGVVKRYGASVQSHTHGVGPVHRSVGSVGANTDPSRIVKGKKMAGQMGHKSVTVMNLDVVKIDAENNLIAVRGAVPGPKKGLLYIRTSVKN